jgi:serine/threonine-protein kinase
LVIGSSFSRYRIVRKLGSGGMGDVYLAEDSTLDRPVALKLLPDGLADEEERVYRFKQEAFAASRLNHPNILTVYEAGSWEGRHFIATEFVDGRTLREVLRDAGRLPADEAIAIAVQVAAALAAAHDAGIVHRDVKLENLMIRPDGYVKVLDFGIAKLRSPDPVTSAEPAALTQTGAVLGTLPFMSPEQARGLEVDARTDIWSFGCVLYELLSGASPFSRSSGSETLVAILEREPAPLGEMVPGIPAELDWIVSKTLRKNPGERYGTAHELAADLRRLQHGRHGAPRVEEMTTSEPTARAGFASVDESSHRFGTRDVLRSRSAIAVAVLLVAAIGVGAWYRLSHAPAASDRIRSLAVLPLRSLAATEDYLGLGIADAVIRQTSQSVDVIVRPTSAVRRYMNEQVDALTAARQLDVEAVLEGNVQRSGERLRVSVNLLRAADGVSLWADSFDLGASDIFAVEDTVARQVASRLRLNLDPRQQARLGQRQTSNPVAYEFYLKALYNFDQRVQQTPAQSDLTISLLQQAIDADGKFAAAHAALAYAYATKAVFTNPTEGVWADRGRAEIDRAESLDPQLAETALARVQLLASRYEGFNLTEAVRVLLAAQRLNPNVGHAELAYLYSHLGLEELATRAAQHALEIDPTSDYAKQQLLDSYRFAGRYDEWLAAYRRFYPGAAIEPGYYLATGRLDDARRALEAATAHETADPFGTPVWQALLDAMKGNGRAAVAAIPALLSRHPVKDPFYHHTAYAVGEIYALVGDASKAVSWLKEAADSGYSPYGLLERDHALDGIRRSREFRDFMAERTAALERLRREFSAAE